MSVIIRIIQIVVCLATLVASYCLIYTQTLSSNQQTTQFLESSRSYEAVSLLVRKQLNENLDSNLQSNPQVTAALDQAVTPEQIKKVLQPTQINLIDWLHSNLSTEKLELQLNLEGLKTQVLGDVTDPNVGFELRKSLPDTLVLTSSEQPSTPFYNLASQLRQSLEIANWLLFWSVATLLGGCALLLILKLRKGSKKFTVWAWPICIASLIMLSVVGVFYILDLLKVSPAISINNINSALSFYIAKAVVSNSTILALVLLGGSVGAIFASRAIFRGRDKKLKEKH